MVHAAAEERSRARVRGAMSLFRDLKNVLMTGSRHPSGGGVSEDRERERPDDDNVDSLASAESLSLTPTDGVAPMAPPNWVPSQQDDRPRH
jgi:hypothetical protein